MEDSLLIALQKAKHYCAYQERCHKEVREKLYSFQLYKKQVEQLITELIEEGFLNEERFALAFARGKFSLKKWGREKIKYELKQRQVSEYCIKKALASIDASAYNKTFLAVAAAKLKTLTSEKNIFIKKQKTKAFLQQKGFELKMIYAFLNDL
ncbi:MAG: regulatory protein RecX [Parafilimonas sp.]